MAKTGTTMMRVGFLAILFALLATIAPSAFVSQADAHDERFRVATPSNDCAFGESFHCGAWSTNGCTAVPDRIFGIFNFNHACDHHDQCYATQWDSRYTCDRRMYRDMNSSCVEMWAWWHPSRAACFGVSGTYYLGVRAFGYYFYQQGSIDANVG